MNENQKLNPLTCELQVGDVVEVLVSSSNIKRHEHAEIIKIDMLNPHFTYCLQGKDNLKSYRNRSELRLISRNGEPIEEQWQPKSGEKVWNTVIKQINVIFEFEGEWYLHGKRPNSGEQLTQKIEERHLKNLEPYTGQDKPQIDFGKAGLILTDGEIMVVTTGAEADNYFEASCLLQSKDFGDFPYIKNKPWRDITAEVQPLLEQLKTLMNGK